MSMTKLPQTGIISMGMFAFGRYYLGIILIALGTALWISTIIERTKNDDVNC